MIYLSHTEHRAAAVQRQFDRQTRAAETHGLHFQVNFDRIYRRRRSKYEPTQIRNETECGSNEIRVLYSETQTDESRIKATCSTTSNPCSQPPTHNSQDTTGDHIGSYRVSVAYLMPSIFALNQRYSIGTRIYDSILLLLPHTNRPLYV